jgi:hypothetical protein
MVAAASSRCTWPVDHTADAGGVVALCGLGRALPLDPVVGTVPWFGLGRSGLTITPAVLSIPICASHHHVMLLWLGT